MRHWTEKTDREADFYFATLPEFEIRRRQDLCGQQITIAFKRGLIDALEDLQAMDQALARSMLARLERGEA